VSRRPPRPPERQAERLLACLTDTLTRSGCELIRVEGPANGAFRLSYEDAFLHRAGLLGRLIALRADGRNPGGANATVTVPEEPSFRSPTAPDHFGLFTSVLLGVDPSRDLFVAFDPARHFPEDEPLRVSISSSPLRRVLAQGWHVWEREEYERDGTGFAETLVGFTAPNLVRYVLFERLAAGLDTGHRQLLAERYGTDVLRARG
jgi:hypothetical protein